MKISRLYYSFHRSAQFLMKLQRKTRIVCKLKNRWKQALGWKRSSNTSHYSYDLRSYCLNFDDAPSNHHIPPSLRR
ncbi:hypothetical protein G2W53_043718 [Senna tora]|uniref:Uncharacterized protein n=1 Tax=Senna tora TaxID=362788 RepID=A0A834W0F4_9FABA|nr:hypothetical protein G2W53_043718 [Senna tora]